MNVDLTDRELALIVRALEELVNRRQASHGLSTDQLDALIQKLSGHSTPDTLPAAELSDVLRPAGLFKRPRKKE